MQKVQTDFGAEVPVRHPVPLPPAVLDAILQGDRGEQLRTCAADDGIDDVGRSLVASAIDLNGDHVLDHVVTAGDFCLQGAHAVPYWLFLSTSTGHQQVFEAVLDGLTIDPPASSAFEVTTFSHTAVTATFTTWRFDGEDMVVVSCRTEDAAGAASGSCTD
jgi:hypothetical protein